MSDERQYFEGVGRRKTSTARVRIYPGGKGNLVVNDRPGAEHYTRVGDLTQVLAPFAKVGMENGFDVSVHVAGGGPTGQTEATRLGVSRALVEFNPEFRGALKDEGYLTRDPRAKERKKPGLKRARKAPTYTKR
ncbi:MAG TPA: 30S ribosomal protein S9 [Anaerolineales bacterium]|nr:30S ribosomal protein S9 [Anaerolineales bacterium]